MTKGLRDDAYVDGWCDFLWTHMSTIEDENGHFRLTICDIEQDLLIIQRLLTAYEIDTEAVDMALMQLRMGL